MPMYWDLELNAHTTIAAVFPIHPPLDAAVPCREEDFKFVIREKGRYPFYKKDEEKESAKTEERRRHGRKRKDSQATPSDQAALRGILNDFHASVAAMRAALLSSSIFTFSRVSPGVRTCRMLLSG